MASASTSAAKQRPKPRSRDAISIDPDEDTAVVDAKQQKTATRSVSPSASSRPKAGFARTSSFRRTPSFAGTENAGLDDDDDEDDFFNRSRRRAVRSRSHQGGHIGTGDRDDVGLSALDEEEEDTLNDNDDDDNGIANDDSSDHGYQSKHPKAYHAAWARTKSLASAKRSKSTLSSVSSDGESDDSTGARRSKVGGGVKKDSKRRRASKSPVLTPPPPVDKNKLKEIEKTIELHLGSSKLSTDDADDEPLTALMHDSTFISELDPDLVRLVRGPQAAEVRKALKERDAQRRHDEEREAQRRRQERRLEQQQRDEEQRQQQSKSQSATKRATATSPLPLNNTIELSDSSADERTRRPARPQRKAAAQSSLSHPTRRQRDSSSPVEAVWVVRKDSSRDPAAKEGSSSSASTYASFVDSSPPAQGGAEVETKSIGPTESATPPVETEEETASRITIVMKGGDQGALQVRVQVRPTMQVKKMLDHFIELHRSSIPQNRTSKVRLRFDGDILKDNDTMEDIGIEDEEQLDVIW